MPRNRNLLSPANPIEQFRQMCLGVKSPYECILFSFKLAPTSLLGFSPTQTSLDPHFDHDYLCELPLHSCECFDKSVDITCVVVRGERDPNGYKWLGGHGGVALAVSNVQFARLVVRPTSLCHHLSGAASGFLSEITATAAVS